ncbi:MAG: pantetheine-phosphate adenylyltransferase [Thermoplasmata archaeon]
MPAAIYAGSFDPPTNGHVWMIHHGVRMFDVLYVAVGENPDKAYTFSLEQRLNMLKEITKDLANIRVISFSNKFLAQFARENKIEFILRGIRSWKDYEFERGMRYINEDIWGGITTVFLMPPRHLCEISSSMVKGLVGPEGWQNIVGQYVPPPVLKVLIEKFS